jgi:endonuclease V-like protein UPF0215 family
MKTGARVAGVAESFTADRSTVAAAVVRADRVLDGVAYTTYTVGGTDATARTAELIEDLDRQDLRAVVIAGIAPAWFNVLNLHTIAEQCGQSVLSVAFEASEGLEPALRREFDDAALQERLEVYRRQPERERLSVNDETLWVRSVGLDRTATADLIRTFTPEGGRPEPVRVARLLARAGDRFRQDS